MSNRYIDDVYIITADSMTPEELVARVGEETAKDIISAWSTSPNIWTAVEKNVESALQVLYSSVVFQVYIHIVIVI